MPNRIVISDASTIIGLSNIDALELLKSLYSQVEVTSIVRDEVGLNLPSWMVTNDNYNESVYRSLVPRLDKGEASSIALALENEDSLLIIDERKGRREATELGLKITGVTGIIIRSKNEGLILSGKEKLDKLMSQGFRLSASIYNLALEKMNENLFT